MPDDPRAALSAVDVLRVYDKARLQRFLDAADQECERLRGLITAAHRRLHEAGAPRSAALHERIGTMVLDARERIAEERRVLEQTVDALAESAEAEAARVVAAARARAESCHDVLGRLGSSAVPDSLPAS